MTTEHTCDSTHDSMVCLTCQNCRACAKDRKRAEIIGDAIGLVGLLMGIAAVILLAASMDS